MTRRGLSALGLGVCAALFGAAPSALAATGNMCQLSAGATFSKPLPMTAGPFALTLSGRLDSCHSDAAAPTGGVIEAGKIYTASDGKQYREPGLSGTGSCLPGGQSTWDTGTVIIRWDDGGVTLLPFKANGEGPGIEFQGDPALASVTLQPVDPNDDPLILTTTVFTGYSSIGGAVVQYDAPADCAGSGVASGTISGFYGPYHF